MFDTIFAQALLPDGSLRDIGVSGGKITSIEPSGMLAEGRERVDLGGELVVPGFVEGHIHLDTSFWGDKWFPYRPCTNGFDVAERVAIQRENIAQAAPMEERARNQLDLCIGQGSTLMRSHVMVDAASTGLRSLETVLAVREAYRDLIDIQLVAFPQAGIVRSPGTAELLDEAVAMGADLVGGLDPASFDRDVEAHLGAIFGIAERRGVGVDIHLHEAGMLGVFTIEQICARTEALGLQGKVAVSHAYGLGDVSEDVARRTGETLARAGVSIMTNAPGDHAFPPIALLSAEGVTVFSGSDNIRDSWWPYGDGDMLGRAMLIGYRSGFYTDAQLRDAFDVVTAAGAKAMGVEDYGLAIGCRADFVSMPARHVPEAVVGVPRKRRVFRSGRLIAENSAVLR